MRKTNLHIVSVLHISPGQSVELDYLRRRMMSLIVMMHTKV